MYLYVYVCIWVCVCECIYVCVFVCMFVCVCENGDIHMRNTLCVLLRMCVFNLYAGISHYFPHFNDIIQLASLRIFYELYPLIL